MIITSNTNLTRFKCATEEQLIALLDDAQRLGRDVSQTFGRVKVTARPEKYKPQHETIRPKYFGDVMVNGEVCLYEQEKLRLGFLFKIGDITKGQYESALKTHIKTHLKNALVTSRHSTKAAIAYQEWLAAAHGQGLHNYTEFYKCGGAREVFLDSLITKPRKQLVWED